MDEPPISKDLFRAQDIYHVSSLPLPKAGAGPVNPESKRRVVVYLLQLALVTIVGDIFRVRPRHAIVILVIVWTRSSGCYRNTSRRDRRLLVEMVLVAGYHVSVIILAHFHCPGGGIHKLLHSQFNLSTLRRIRNLIR